MSVVGYTPTTRYRFKDRCTGVLKLSRLIMRFMSQNGFAVQSTLSKLLYISDEESTTYEKNLYMGLARLLRPDATADPT